MGITFQSNNPFFLPQKSDLKFCNNQPLKIKPDAFSNLIKRWEGRLLNSLKRFYKQLEDETGLTPERFKTYAQDESFYENYLDCCYDGLEMISEYTTQEDSDPKVIAFIKRLASKYCPGKQVKIILTAELECAIHSFKSEEDNTYYLLCLDSLFSPEHVDQYYQNLLHGKCLFYVELTDDQKVRFMECSSLMENLFILAASKINHDANMYEFLTYSLPYLSFPITDKTKDLCRDIFEMRALLETVFQAKDPLEAALFFSRLQRGMLKEGLFWKRLLSELRACYEQSALNDFDELVSEFEERYLE